MDPGTVSSLVDKIRDLAASSFAEAGFTSPVMDLSATSDGGKRVEKVTVSKNGEKYLAKRENEVALYELNASTVAELQKSAADLKPAAVSPPPSKKK
jgi:BRCT domain type II-containing protein